MSTAGVDFWVTFMTNNGKSTQKPADLPTIKLSVIAVSDAPVTVVVADANGSQLGTINLTAANGLFGKLENIPPAAAYLDPTDGETIAPKGLHIYAQDAKTKFSCYALSEVGEDDGTTRDATLLIPCEFLDKEYIVQTYPDAGGTSTEFAVVATEDNTEVTIIPNGQTANGINPGTPINVTLNKGQVYMVPSVPTGQKVNMSGSKVCADKPVAVFQGNEATKIPSSGANSPSHPFEQTAPQSMWGSEFYFGITEHATRTYFYVTAAYDNTVVTIDRANASPLSYTLAAGESLNSSLFLRRDLNVIDTKITSTKPVMCCTYLSSGALNAESVIDPVTLEEIAYYTWGNPTNAMLPAWSMRSKKVNFYADTVRNQTSEGVQKMYVQVITKTADVNKLSLDGMGVDASLFTTMVSDNTMSVANIELTTVGKHTLSTTGDGFVGFVYSLTTEARAFQYTLGFNPAPYRDSLFITNPEDVMSPRSYNLPRLDQGWYQRQLEEWPISQERLDTAYVCDSTTLNFFGQLSNPDINDSIVWKIYRCDDAGNKIEPAIAAKTSETIGTLSHLYDYQFIIDPQKSLLPHERTPFEYFSVDMEKYHKHIICTDIPDDADTLRTMVRVNRQYNDTILRRVVCVTDKVQCFNDDEGHTTVSATSKPTTFMSRDQLPSPLTPFADGFDVGYNVYKRQYQTVNGCDSIMWFELYVCDTVRIILDTTVCENEPLKFDGSLYFQNTNFDHQGTYLDTIKTHNCDALKVIDPTFQGCDSIFQVNLTICPIYRDTLKVQYCSHGDWSVPYQWDRNTEHGVLDITVSEEDQGQTKFYSDTLKTKTCPDCHNHGCDSIFVLQLFISPYFKDEKTDAYCGQRYVPELNEAGEYIGYGSLVDNDYPWTKHETHTVWDVNNQTYIPASEIKNMALGTTNTFIDSMSNTVGCDSIFVLKLTRNKAFLGKDEYTTPNNEAYTWHNVVYGPYEDWNDTIIYIRDEQATVTSNGCDSIWMLELQISQSFKRTDYHTICDDSLFVWQEHESRVTVPRLSAGHYIYYDSLKMTRQGVLCDSIWILDLTVNSTYKKYDTIYVCDKDTFTWQHRHYAGSNAPSDPAFVPVITLPLGLFNDSVHYSTDASCDSAHYLTVYTHQTFSFTESAVVCQDSNYVWQLHEGHALTDENGNPVVISTAVEGEYIYIDHLYTTDCSQCNGTNHGCDSIYTLTLTVNPSYIGNRIIIVKDTICSLDLPYIWTGHTNKDGSPMTFTESTTIRDTIKTIGCNCDSIVELRLHVEPNAPQFIDRTVCQTVEPFTIGAQQLYFSPGDSLPGTYVSTAIIPVAGGCQYTETVTITVNAAYTNLTEQQMTCQVVGEHITWRGQDIDISNPGISTRVDSQLTVCCNCDSVTTFTLEVFPQYYQDSAAEMSDEMIIYWDGYTYVGENVVVAPGTIVEAVITKDTIIVHEHPVVHHGQFGNLVCDSTRTLSIRYGTIFRDTIEGRTCANVPFEWVGIDQAGNDSTRMIIPVSGLKNDSIYADRHRTTLDFDSIYFLHLTVDPYYPEAPERTTIDHVCQGDTYDWIDHAGKQYIIQNTGTYVFYDSITTIAHGCDSIWKLELRVDSVYHFTDQLVVCDNDTISWEHRLFVGANFSGTYDATHYHRVHSGLTTASSNPAFCDTTYSTIYGCDSTRVLNLLVYRTFLDVAAADTAYRHICDNDTLHYYDGQYNLNGEWRTGDHTLGRQVLTFMDTTVLGCDSLAAMVVYVHPTWSFTANDTTTCQNSQFTWPDHEQHTLWCPEKHTYLTTIPTDVAETFTLVDSLKTISCPDCKDGVGCDSVWTLRLTVTPTHNYSHTARISDESVYFWEHKLYIGVKVNPDTISDALYHGEPIHTTVVAPTGRNEYDTLYFTETYHCDSLENLTLIVGPTYRDTLHDQHTCINEPYTWYRSGELTDRIITPTPAMINAVTYFSDTLQTKEFGFDSIKILELIVHPTYLMPADYDSVCRNDEYHWLDANGHEHTQGLYGENHIHYTAIPTDTVGWITIYDSLKTVTCPTCQAGVGCDSVHVLHLYVAPTYRWPHRHTISDEETYFWEHKLYIGEKVNPDTISDALYHGEPVHKTVVAYAGVNEYDTLYHTVLLGCDSIEALTLLVGPTYRDTLHDQHTCINTPYTWHRSGELTDRVITPTQSMVNVVTYFSDTLLTKDFGFDSIQILELAVHPTYLMPADYDTVCKDEPYIWLEHEYKTIPTDVSGWITIYDSLKTKTCPTCQSGVGCDSVHTLNLYVAPTYHHHETGIMCDNTTFLWQRRLYVGAHYDLQTYGTPAATTPDYDQVIYLPDQDNYDDLAHYTTTLLCDSNYYLDLTINHSEFYLIRDKISDNNKTWSFGHGNNYHRGQDYNYPDLSDTTRVPYSLLLIDTVKTPEGCDIIYHDSLTVYPEYRFRLDTFTCSNETFNWRQYHELNHRHTGFYYDSLKTVAGFDSVYVLFLEIFPGFEVTYNRDFCKNDTIYWQYEKLYWHEFEGDQVVNYKAEYHRSEGCDSVYFLNVWYKNYYHYPVRRDTICRYDEYHWFEDDGTEHTRALRGEHGEVFTSIPNDTVGLIVIYDSLHTSASCHCDSTFTLELFVKPAYHFYESHDPVCTGTTVEWRGQTYTSDVATVITDNRSFLTTGDCDSVFHFTVEFYQSYDYETEYFEVCADHGHFEWHGISFDEEMQRSLSERHTVDDTIVRAKIYNTTLGCDSTYHIQLVIHPVLWEEWDDTICVGESYHFFSQTLTEKGTYYDTTYTEFGCPAYQVVNLAVEPATRFNIVADSACADYGEYLLRIGYDGLRPDSFAIFYDSLAHARGFIDVPKDTFISDHIELALPQATPFLRPDNYTATLFFYTRHCKEDSTMLNRYNIQVRYPSSILKQMWNDAIAIYDSAYNGGYRFEKFQWFHNDAIMPGQISHFLYQPHWLENGQDYAVELTRVGEDYGIMTCPLTIEWTGNDKVTPSMQYLSVVPTMVSRDYPVTNILSLIEGNYKVINPTGSTIQSGRIVPDEHHAMYVTLPAVAGLYVIEMSDDEGNSRTVKVMVY